MATAVHDTVTQALPTPGAGPRLLHTPVHSIAPSLTNPRKTFDATKLQELADSIKASGVHQPVLLRPLPAHRLEDTHREARANNRPAPEFELIAGERRWRASQLAGLAEIPAMVRPMTDTEALEAQVIENLQREDVTELEEAEGYEVLMRTGNLNADQVGAKIGKSRSYVYARLKVLDLCQQGREALREGNLDFSKALLIARIPNETLQIEALAYCTLADILNLGKVGAHSALIEYAKTTRAPDQLHLLVIMQRDSGANHYSHNRPKNEGLMLVAGNVFGERLPEIVSECQAHAKAEHLPKPVKAAAPKDDLPLPPAAQAIPTREGGKAKGAKGKTTPAAQARATAPKTTKAEAAAQIAAALAEAEGGQDQAPAAHGNEGAPAPAGDGAGDAAPSNSAAPVKPSAAWPNPETARKSTATDSAAAPSGEAGAGAETGATVAGGDALVITSGTCS